MATIELSKDNFDQTMNGHAMVVVDFWAPWCAPCRMFGPVFEAASEQHADVVFAKVNTEEEQELGAAFGIRAIPTLMILRGKVILHSQAGALTAKQLAAVLEQAKAQDRELAEQQAKDGEQETSELAKTGNK